MTIRLVQNDTAPPIVVSLTDAVTREPIDLSDAGTAVALRFRPVGSAEAPETLVGTKLPGKKLSDGTLDMTVTPAGKGGRVQFPLGQNTLAGAPGAYEGEIQITFPDATVQTVYDTIQFIVRAAFT